MAMVRALKAGLRATGSSRALLRGFSTDVDPTDKIKPVLKAPASGDTDTHDDFKPVVKKPAGSVHETIAKDIKENPVMLYMKGIPDAPQCGFSAMVVSILKHHKVPFSSRNVLEDSELREGVKTFSNWPTVPQVYIEGEFIGGCDILKNMHQSGELAEKLKDLKPSS